MVRQLTNDDVPAAFELSHSAEWNQTPEDWQRFLKLEPDGCFGIDCDSRLVSTAALLCHGQNLAWLGMVLTHPDYRRRGNARCLVEAALSHAEQRGIRTVKLDATDQGRPLYHAHGFEDEQPVERWHRPPGPLECSLHSFSLGPPDAELDRMAFGADRSRFLTALGPAWRMDNGFVMHRRGSRARHLGPCVARDAREAEPALRAMVASRPETPWFWDLLPRQVHAVEIARSLGFAPVRRLTRMRRGVPLSSDERLVYAIAGFEAG
jgi:GNAT superfamily N-acetyltransferase